jgi:sigma-B regulation protein RsbU (phosphoserine phosphatase)
MVALIKNIFNTMGHTFYIPDFFSHCTRLLRKMRLGMMYMSLTLLRIKGNRVTFSAAGMPPILLFRSAENAVEQLVLKGLPLGGIESASYQQKNFTLEHGDTLLMMTDGYVELFNPDMESLDYPRIIEIFRQNGHKTPEEIIQQLVEKGEEWAAGQTQSDDITFIVLKYEENKPEQ